MGGSAKSDVTEQVLQELGLTQLELVKQFGLTQLKSKDLPLNQTEFINLLEKISDWQKHLGEATKI